MPDSRLLVGARPAAAQFRRLRRIILPVVIRDQERSITVAQLQRRIGQRIRHSRRSRGSGRCRAPRSCHRRCLPPRMKPAITMLSPVLTKARVLMLASFEAAAWLEVVDFNQSRHLRCCPCLARSRYTLRESASHQSLIRDYWSARMPVASISASCTGSSLQLSLVTVTNPPGPCSSSTGSASASGTPVVREGPMARRSTCLGARSRDDEPADANIITGLNSHPSREVEGLRCWGRGLRSGWASASRAQRWRRGGSCWRNSRGRSRWRDNRCCRRCCNRGSRWQ